MDKENEEEQLSKIQNITVGAISSLGTSILYGTGINLSRTVPNGIPIFVGTVVLSFISPHLLYYSSRYVFQKYNQKKRKRRK